MRPLWFEVNFSLKSIEKFLDSYSKQFIFAVDSSLIGGGYIYTAGIIWSCRGDPSWFANATHRAVRPWLWPKAFFAGK